MTTFVSYAQNCEDVLLWRALKQIRGGTYIDVGAQHPVQDSVSLAFYERGWRGLHVEPVPAYARALQDHRPDETVLNVALSAKKGNTKFFEVRDTGLSTGVREIVAKHAEKGHHLEEYVVSTDTLSSVFAMFNTNEVHWLKIDVEGMERDVLRGWGKSKTRPWIVVVESTLPNSQEENHAEWEQELLKRQYTFAYFDGLNRFYVSAQHPELHAALKCGANSFDEYIPLKYLQMQEKAQRLESRCETLSKQVGDLTEAIVSFTGSTQKALADLATESNRVRQDGLQSLSLGSAPGQLQVLSLRFGKGHSTELLATGFCLPEEWGTWSSALISTIEIPVGGLPHDAALLSITMPVQLIPDLARYAPVLRVSSDGIDACVVFFREHSPTKQDIQFNVRAVAPITAITFELTHLSTPVTRATPEDERLLGFGVTSMRIELLTDRAKIGALSLLTPPILVGSSAG
jgi:FkbM family methyltransferase